jgi:hypothetical protein
MALALAYTAFTSGHDEARIDLEDFFGSGRTQLQAEQGRVGHLANQLMHAPGGPLLEYTALRIHALKA